MLFISGIFFLKIMVTNHQETSRLGDTWLPTCHTFQTDCIHRKNSSLTLFHNEENHKQVAGILGQESTLEESLVWDLVMSLS